MTQPDTLHSRLRAEVDRRLAVARAATLGPWRPGIDDTGLVWVEQEEAGHTVADVAACADHPGRQLNDAAHVALHDPADAIRRYTADLQRLDEHAPSTFLTGRCDECGEVRCGGCDGHMPCEEVLRIATCYPEVAGRLGVSVDG